MPDEAVVPIAPIPLARSARRLLLAPGVLLLAGAVAIGGGLLIAGWQGIGLVVAGAVVVVLAVWLALLVFSVRLEVEVATLRLRWLGVDREYQLSPGAVTRVSLEGPAAAKLRSRFGALGWGLGPARLRGSERVQLVRLARTPSIILIPTDSGRVAVAPRSEAQLISALSAAARVQQRLDQVALQTRAIPPPRPIEPPPAEAAPPHEPDMSRVLTGIERVLLEQRLAAERAATLARAEAERRAAAEEAARRAAAPVPAPEPAQPVPAAAGARVRPAWMRPPRARIGLPPRGALGAEALRPYLLPALPLLAAVGVWAYASFSGRMAMPEPELRTASLALSLAGPVAALAALAVRAWFPRLLGLVTITSLCALILVGRALLL